MLNRLIGLLIVLCCLSLLIGANPISWHRFLQSMSFANEINTTLLTLTASRIPRVVAIVLTGISLALSGVVLQHIVRNKFVEPATSGGLDSAKLGVLVAVTLFPAAGAIGKMLIALLFSFVASALFILLVKRIRFKSTVLIPVIGLMYGSVLNAIAEFYAYKHGFLQSMQGWLLGDFSKVVQGHYELIYMVIPIVAITYLYAHRFTVVGMGEDMAKNLGLSYGATVAIGLGLVSLTIATTVIIVGAIAFVGLVITNLVALKYGDNLAHTLPIVALGGACLLLFCDIVGRLLIYPFEVPIGLTAGGIGGIIFLSLIVKRPRQR